MTKEELKQKISVIISAESTGNTKCDELLVLIDDIMIEEEMETNVEIVNDIMEWLHVRNHHKIADDIGCTFK